MTSFRKTSAVRGKGSSVVAWQEAARCRGLSARRADELFFAERPTRSGTTQAVLFCRQCPVRRECAALGLAYSFEQGIFGGLPFYARKALRVLFYERVKVDHRAFEKASVRERFVAFRDFIDRDPEVLVEAVVKGREDAHAAQRRRQATQPVQRVSRVPVGESVPTGAQDTLF